MAVTVLCNFLFLDSLNMRGLVPNLSVFRESAQLPKPVHHWKKSLMVDEANGCCPTGKFSFMKTSALFEIKLLLCCCCC